MTHFAFGPRNYRLMFIGLAVLAVGFITMTLDSAPYGEGFLGITLGPILLIIGFLIEFWAIMAKSGKAVEPEPGAPTSAAAPTTTAPTTARPVAPAAPVSPTYTKPRS